MSNESSHVKARVIFTDLIPYADKIRGKGVAGRNYVYFYICIYIYKQTHTHVCYISTYIYIHIYGWDPTPTRSAAEAWQFQIVMQCVAVCCSVLQCVIVCCSVLQLLQCVAVCQSRHTNLIPYAAKIRGKGVVGKKKLTRRYTLQHTATRCNTLQHTATHDLIPYADKICGKRMAGRNFQKFRKVSMLLNWLLQLL